MKEIEFSVMYHNDRAVIVLEDLLARFEAEAKVHVRLRILSWIEAWGELVKVALYKAGPDVSEIGSSWVSDFARMLAFRSFTPADIKSLGGESAFLASSWMSVTQDGQPELSALPWLADTRVLYYRRDLMEKAGIAEETAFQTPENMQNTLERLKSTHVELPWVVPTHRSRMTLHNAASWVWGAGGGFLSPDGKAAYFTQPEALRGFEQYFSLIRFMPPDARDHDDTGSDRAYWQGNAAATISGTWLMVENAVPKEVSDNSAFVSPPGIPYIGGSCLGIWRHSHYESQALDLVRFFSKPEVQAEYCQVIGLLPTSMDALALPNYQTPLYQRLIERIKGGRSFRPLPLWGMVEEKLTASLSQIWSDLLMDPQPDISQVIALNLQPLGRRLNISLSGQ